MQFSFVIYLNYVGVVNTNLSVELWTSKSLGGVKMTHQPHSSTKNVFKHDQCHAPLFVSLRPQVSGVPTDHRQQPSTTAKYYIRSELKQFGKYLTGVILVMAFDSELKAPLCQFRCVGVGTSSSGCWNQSFSGNCQSAELINTDRSESHQRLSIYLHDQRWQIGRSIRLHSPLLTWKWVRTTISSISNGYLFVTAHDSNENLTGISMTSDLSNPPSRRNSIGANDYPKVWSNRRRLCFCEDEKHSFPSQNDSLENNGQRTYKLDRAYTAEPLSARSEDSAAQPARYDSTVPFQAYTADSKTAQPGQSSFNFGWSSMLSAHGRMLFRCASVQRTTDWSSCRSIDRTCQSSTRRHDQINIAKDDNSDNERSSSIGVRTIQSEQ